MKTGADVFGYSATVEEAPGIGQSFPKIAGNVDVISSMVYPSHWSPNDFGIAHPDLEPYKTVDKYLDREHEVLKKLENTNRNLVLGYKILQQATLVKVTTKNTTLKLYKIRFKH